MTTFNSNYAIGDVVAISSYGSDKLFTGIIDAVQFNKEDGQIFPAYLCRIGESNTGKDNTLYAYNPNGFFGEGEPMYQITHKVGVIHQQ